MRFKQITEERYVSDAIIDALAEGGVRFVLGMPGGLTAPLWRSLHEHPVVRAVQVREESIGALMAEAIGRLTAHPAVVMGQGEWIVGNAGQGYLEALLGSSPLLILTEMSDGGPLSHHAPYQSGTGDYGTWDARTALAGVTKRVMVSHSPAQAVQHTQLALKHALTGQPGPVAVVYHSSALRGRVGPTSSPRLYPSAAYLPTRARAVDEAELARTAESLRRAERPVILAGNGVRLAKGRASLGRLARTIDAPVATTSGGKGVFPETDPLAVGVIGPFGWASANAVVGDADLVLAIGTKLGPSDTMDESPALLDPERQTLVQIDVEPLNAGWTFPIDHVLIGDAAHLMDRIADVCGALENEAARGAARAAVARGEQVAIASEELSSDEVPLHPRRIISILEELFPDEGTITCDAGENRLFMMQWYRVKEAGEYLQPAAGGGMGYAVPAAMASKLALPERPAMAVCGDGGFAMSLHALMTAVQENLATGVLVLNNGALGWVLHGMGPKAVAARLAEFDHAAIARSMGCDGVRVSCSDDLRNALAALPGISRPLVIDVPTSLTTSFEDLANNATVAEQARATH